MKPIAKFGELPFYVDGICVFAATDGQAQAITDELFIIGERSTRIFDLVNHDTSEIYKFKQMVSRGKDLVELPLSATATEVQQALGKNQFAVKVYDIVSGDVLGYAYKFFTHKFVLSNGLEVPVVDFNKQTTQPVPIVPVTGVIVTPKTISALLPNSVSGTLIVDVQPSDATNKNVTYSSSDETIATVTSSGFVTALKNGNVDITVTTVDGGFTAVCEIDVKTEVQSISITNASTPFQPGQTQQLNATILPVGAEYNASVDWISSNDAVATVSSTGLVTYVSNGDATITVSASNGAEPKTATYTALTRTRLQGIEFNHTTFTGVVGGTDRLITIYTPSTASNQNITWATSDSSVATVSFGVVSFTGMGTVEVTATSQEGNFVATCVYTVVSA
jgi:Bacterial surface proteins containing Ig-like domains